jgi:hypothetical protein
MDPETDFLLAQLLSLKILAKEGDQVEIPLWPEEKDLVHPPETAPWALFKLIPSLVSSKSIHVKSIIVKIPVEQLQYKHGDEDPRQFYADEYGFISNRPPPHFPTAMNVDFGEITPRLDLSYDNMQLTQNREI